VSSTRIKILDLICVTLDWNTKKQQLQMHIWITKSFSLTPSKLSMSFHVNNTLCNKFWASYGHTFHLPVCSWERRVDQRGRVYYVDHNTRTTTWQRPSMDFVANVQNWQQQWDSTRSQAFEQLQNRSLFSSVAPQQPQEDSSGPLPKGWGQNYCFFILWLVFHEVCFTHRNNWIMV